ncbi:MAG TPA: S8 family serine peptidase [Actinoallomurus sp.]
MRSPQRLLAALGALGMALVSALPAAAAAPHPRTDEWWFAPWSIEQKIWPVTQGHGVTVALLDGGVNVTLPEIAGAVLPGADMSGHGTDGRTDLSKYGHSTSMAALIAGQGGGRSRFVGTAPQAKILPVDVTGGAISPDRLATTLAKGIRFAADHGAKVITMPLGARASSPCPSTVMDAIAYAVRRDVVLVAAAGNSGNTDNDVEFPASCPGVLAVGATDDYSRPWSQTQAHDYVSVAAPGVDMPTIGKNKNYYYAHTNGTSNSTALVSAAAALVRAANPTMSGREVVHRLIATALDVNTPGSDAQTGYGIVRISRALDTSYVVPANSPNPPYERFDQGQNPRTGVPSATVPPGASRNGLSLGRVVLMVVLILVVGVLAVLVAGRFVRRSVQSRRSVDDGPASAPTPADPASTAGPAHSPGQGDPVAPAGFDKKVRPIFEPPHEDHPSGE